MFNLKPTTYLWISLFCFFMCITSGICLLFVEPPTTFYECFIGYGLGTVSFFAIGIAKGLE